jgi:P27 family predicted phage terminase small subunit
MARRGRKRQPTALKVARGTYRRDRDGDPDREPGVSLSGYLPPPDRLGAVACATWETELPTLIAAGHVTDLDLGAFELYCRAVGEVARLDKLLIDEGEYFTAQSGYVGQHPAVNQRFKWLNIIARFQEAFWLTPTARAGKHVPESAPPVVSARNRA